MYKLSFNDLQEYYVMILVDAYIKFGQSWTKSWLFFFFQVAGRTIIIILPR